MFIKAGDIVSINHYSSPYPVKTVVVDAVREISSDILSVRITHECCRFNFLEDDPVVLGFEREGKVYFTNCYVSDVDIKKSEIRLAVDNEEFIVNSRAFERFPVSIYADVEQESRHLSFVAVVKNISLQGLMICSKMDVQEGSDLNICIYLDKQEIRMLSRVRWQIQKDKIYEYGLKTGWMDYTAQKMLTSYLCKLKQEQELLIEKLKGEMG